MISSCAPNSALLNGMRVQSEYVHTERKNKRKTEETTMKSEGIKRTEEYTENKTAWLDIIIYY